MLSFGLKQAHIITIISNFVKAAYSRLHTKIDGILNQSMGTGKLEVCALSHVSNLIYVNTLVVAQVSFLTKRTIDH
jgi:hypothetical protein